MAESQLFSLPKPKRFALQVDSDLRPEDISTSKSDTPVQPANPRISKKCRNFKVGWYKDRPWLEYSLFKNAGFCFCCNWFGGVKSSFSSTDGWTNFRHSERLSEHESNAQHINAWITYQDYLKTLSGKSVAELIDKNHDKQVIENRAYIVSIIEALLYCARQNIGIRGHREACTSDVIPGLVGDSSSNRGNFLELMMLIGRHDKMIASKLNNPTKNATYLSKSIQNELIITMGAYVTRKISSEVKKLRLFSVFDDETKDRAKVEQVAVGVRYLKLREIFKNVL